MKKRIARLFVLFVITVNVIALPVFAENEESMESTLQDFYWSEWSCKEPPEGNDYIEIKKYRYRVMEIIEERITYSRWSAWFDKKEWEEKKTVLESTLNENQSLDIDAVTRYKYKLPLLEQTIECNNSFVKTYGDAPFYLDASAKTKLSYSSSNENIIRVLSDGRVIIKNPANETVIITVKAQETERYKAAVKKVNVKVRLGKPLLTMSYSKKTRKIQLKWNKVIGATRYQVYQYDYSKKKYILKDTGPTNAVGYSWVGKRGKTYKCKIRAYKVVDGKRVYSPFSSVKTVAAE